MNTQFKKGALELCVLSQLVKGDKYGSELTERISHEMSHLEKAERGRLCDHLSGGIGIGSGPKVLSADG